MRKRLRFAWWLLRHPKRLVIWFTRPVGDDEEMAV